MIISQNTSIFEKFWGVWLVDNSCNNMPLLNVAADSETLRGEAISREFFLSVKLEFWFDEFFLIVKV